MRNDIPSTPKERRAFYLQQAAEAERLASEAHDIGLQASWRRIAMSWRELAEQMLKKKI